MIQIDLGKKKNHEQKTNSLNLVVNFHNEYCIILYNSISKLKLNKYNT